MIAQVMHHAQFGGPPQAGLCFNHSNIKPPPSQLALSALPHPRHRDTLNTERGRNMVDSLSKKILEEYAARHSMDLFQLSAVLKIDWDQLSDPVRYLQQKGFLQIEANHKTLNEIKQDLPISPDTPLEISHLGRVALEEEKGKSRKAFWSEFRAWVTLFIAVAAFIKSFFF